jgi:hypothetical protein
MRKKQSSSPLLVAVVVTVVMSALLSLPYTFGVLVPMVVGSAYVGQFYWGYMPCPSGQSCQIFWMVINSGSPLGQVGSKYRLIFGNPSYPAPDTSLGMTNGTSTIEVQGQLAAPSSSTGFDGDIHVSYCDFTGVCGQNGLQWEILNSQSLRE